MRMKRLVLSISLMLGVAAGALVSCGPEPLVGTTSTADFPYGLTQTGAEAFITRAEADLMQMNEYASRASWVMNNFITEDTQWLQARASAEVEHAPDALCARCGALRRRRNRPRHSKKTGDPEARHHAAIANARGCSPGACRPSIRGSTAAYSTGKFSLQGQGDHARRCRRNAAHVARSRRAEGDLGRLAHASRRR